MDLHALHVKKIHGRMDLRTKTLAKHSECEGSHRKDHMEISHLPATQLIHLSNIFALPAGVGGGAEAVPPLRRDWLPT